MPDWWYNDNESYYVYKPVSDETVCYYFPKSGLNNNPNKFSISLSKDKYYLISKMCQFEDAKINFKATRITFGSTSHLEFNGYLQK